MKLCLKLGSIVFIIGALFYVSCSKEHYGNKQPNFTTGETSSLQPTSVTITGYLTGLNGGPVQESGHVWSSVNDVPDLAINDGVSKDGAVSKGAFASLITTLRPGTLYFVRGYLQEGNDVWYGNIISFKTPAQNVLTVQTGSDSLTTSIGTYLTGYIINTGAGSTIVQYGHVWSNSDTLPTISDNKTSLGTVSTPQYFFSPLQGLASNTKYYARAYATNSAGQTVYGNLISFTTKPLQGPTVQTGLATSISYNSFMVAGTIVSIGNSAITAYGHVWSATNSSPSLTDNSDNLGSSNVALSFNSNLSGLLAGTTYYVRAYATNNAGTVYGNTISVITTANTLASVTTGSVANISSSGCTVGGTINSLGNTTVTQFGHVWSSSNQLPTISNSLTQLGTAAVGSFNSTITGLTAGTTYYIRAYATNSAGTVYGSMVSVTTLSPLPIVVTGTSSKIGVNNFDMSGQITYVGTSPISQYGFCFSATNPIPSLANTVVNIGGTSSTTTFSHQFSGLTAGTYYVDAFATNSSGTVYGSVVSVNINYVPPSISTDSLTYRSSSPILYLPEPYRVYATIQTPANLAITSYGFCYSSTNTLPDLTGIVHDLSVVNGIPSNFPYSFNEQPYQGATGVIYYVRSYVTTNQGTIYGSVETYKY